MSLSSDDTFVGILKEARQLPPCSCREDWGGDLDLIDPKQIEDGKLQNVECFRLEYNFRDEQVKLWIDKQSYLVRQIDERIKAPGR